MKETQRYIINESVCHLMEKITDQIASHAVVFRGLVLLPTHWGGSNTSTLKTTAWEATNQIALQFCLESDKCCASQQKINREPLI